MKTAVLEKSVYVLPTQTELPAPWGRIDVSSPSSLLPSTSSAFNPTTNAFTLSAYSPNAETKVNHFVYQSLAGDGSIVAKVQLAASNSSTAKAGVMLRQNNEVSSPFVFAYVSNGKISVEYLDPATNQVVTLEGGLLSAATEARFLKIERKEGSVYVYESGDSLNFRQIAIVTLALTGSVNVGLVSDISNGFMQGLFDSVLVQAQAQEAQSQAAFTATPTKGNAPLTVEFDASTSTGGNLTYEWDFGDGTTGTGVRVSHIYDQLGSYVPKLTVTNSQGSSTFEDRIVVSTYTEGSKVIQLQPTDEVVGFQLHFGRAEFGRDIGFFAVGANVITKLTEAKFTLSSQAATTYPEGAGFEKLYPKGNVVPIGPLITLELPFDSISTSASESLRLFTITPAIYEDVEFEDYAETGVEVRIQRADGTEKFYLEDSFPGSSVLFTDDTFTNIYKENTSAIIKVSVQPVDYLGVTKKIQNSLPTPDIKQADLSTFQTAQATYPKPPGADYSNPP